MTTRAKLAILAAASAAALTAGGVAVAGNDDDGSERPISGQALDRASAAALAETGGGKVTETEVGDEEGAYEVEVTRADGSQVDVHLDKDFNVLSTAGDDDGSGEDDGAGDD